MSNAVTGDYDAVVEITTEAIVRMLATIHQNGASPDASPTFLHSVALRVGDVPELAQFELAQSFLQENFGDQIADITTIPHEVLQAIQQDLLDTQKAASKVVQDVGQLIASDLTENVASIVGSLIDIAFVRGLGQLQVGTLGISLTSGSANEVVVHAPIRAHYYPDPGTVSLPAPIHGEVQAVFTLDYNPSGSDGKPVLEAKATTDKSKITFIPAPGTLTAAQTGQITREIQRFVMTKFGEMSAEVPAGFKFGRFKGLVAGSTQALALPIKLTGKQLPASALAGVTNLFLASSDDFAVAISKDYLDGLLQGPLTQIKQLDRTYYLQDEIFGITWASGHVWVVDASVEWESGGFSLVIEAHLHIWKAIGSDEDYAFTVTQNLTLTLDSDNLTLHVVGEPTISAGLPQDYADRARPDIEAARDAALQNVQPIALTAIPIDDALKTFGAGAHFSSLEITANGVMLHGKVTVSARPDMFVDFIETSDGSALTAFKSWVPAGTISQFVWSWMIRSSPLPWAGTVKQVSSQHDFIFRWGAKPSQKPWEVSPPPWQIYNMCLSIDGVQVGTWAGSAKQVSGSANSGGSCGFSWPEWLAILPAWWANLLMVPIWGPDPADRVLESGITAHVNVRPSIAPASAARTSALVHLADGKQATLPPLSEAMHRSKHRQSGIPIIVVLPTGSFRQSRSALEASLGSFREDLALPLVITEDYQGDWTRSFGAADNGATFLLSPEGEVAWKHQGQLDATSLAAALDQHAVAPQRRRSRLLRTAMRVGQSVPDVIYEAAHGRGRRGRRLLLLFWKSWSTPCISELVRLQQRYGRIAGRGPTIMAIADGEDQKHVDEIVRQHHLGFLVVPDLNREISRRCGINCWPTLVAVREDGRISAINYGATHPPRRPAGAAAA